MLTLVLAETEIEQIPKKILFHPDVKSSAKKRGKKPNEIILNSSYHHSAMKKIKEGYRRGRPDILHFFLINTLESILNKQDKLKTVIHTRNDEAIYVTPETRIMRDYNRFIGLMEQLFEKKYVPNKEKPLLYINENQTLEDIIEKSSADIKIGFSTKGKQVNLPAYFNDLKQKNMDDVLCVIGGFPKDSYKNNIQSLTDKVLSICNKNLSSWTVANEIIVNYENVY
ncbi:MAG: 16S rRNA methyltransferase [Candidatus Thermoplasmatota archaeon]